MTPPDSTGSTAPTGTAAPTGSAPAFRRPPSATASHRHSISDTGMEAEAAYHLVHDETMLDGNARLNLATFVSTWMDDYADKIYAESYDKNMIDKDEYPQTAAIEDNCWRMIAGLWNCPDVANTIGTSTIGSSEACMLGGLALKRRWQLARHAVGKPTGLPNLIMSSAVQVVWEKFCNYWDVEARYVPISAEHPVLDGHDLARYVDENTIGVVAIMGQTYTGSLRAGAADRRRPRRDPGEDRLRRADPRRRGVRRHDRAVPAARPGLGLPARTGAFDQHLRPQVRPGLPGSRLGGLAHRRLPARRPHLQRQLPRRQHADPGAQLLPARRPGSAAVLPLPASRARGLPGDSAGVTGRRALSVGGNRRTRRVRAGQRRLRHPGLRLEAARRGTPTSGISTTCPTGCG